MNAFTSKKVLLQQKVTTTAKNEYFLYFRPQGCPCGYYTDPRRTCHCTPRQIQQYMSRVSGPLLDRIDIQIEVPAVEYRDLAASREGLSSAEMRESVCEARAMQQRRFAGDGVLTNAQMSNKLVRRHCALDGTAEAILHQAMTELALSARAYNKILKVARTIADLNGSENIKADHVAEAIQYRTLDRALRA